MKTAKFECQGVVKIDGGFNVALNPVPNAPENAALWDENAVGNINLSITNPEAVGYFTPGESFIVTFEKVTND